MYVDGYAIHPRIVFLTNGNFSETKAVTKFYYMSLKASFVLRTLMFILLWIKPKNIHCTKCSKRICFRVWDLICVHGIWLIIYNEENWNDHELPTCKYRLLLISNLMIVTFISLRWHSKSDLLTIWVPVKCKWNTTITYRMLTIYLRRM